MAGYKGWSMSNNAVSAYECGEKPLSKWTKTAVIEAIENAEVDLNCNIEKLRKMPAAVLKDVCLCYSSWHHTSSHFNQTDFYSLDLERIGELTDDQIDKMIAGYKAEDEPTEERWTCTFLEWSGSRKHPTATEVTEDGVVKGKWFYRKDGSKKKTTANGFRFVKRLDDEKSE